MRTPERGYRQGMLCREISTFSARFSPLNTQEKPQQVLRDYMFCAIEHPLEVLPLKPNCSHSLAVERSAYRTGMVRYDGDKNTG